MAGAALVLAFQAQGQVTAFVDQDLLLNFRAVDSQTPPNVVVDLGNINTFLSTVASVGGTAVLDEPGVTAGYTTQFTASDLISTLGTPSSGNVLGFSAAAEIANPDNTLYLTRVISGPSADGSGLTASAKQSGTAQSATSQAITVIGAGYNTGVQLGSGNAATVSAGDPNSYYSQAVDGTGTMNYKASQNSAAGAGGLLEGAQDGSGNVYLALWEVPPTVSRSNPGVADTYEGYFTFQTDGEVDFTAASAAPEPSTYALLIGSAAGAWAMRRKKRA